MMRNTRVPDWARCSRGKWSIIEHICPNQGSTVRLEGHHLLSISAINDLVLASITCDRRWSTFPLVIMN